MHQETCTRASYEGCYEAGYVEGNKGTTITYGKLGEMGAELESGDALNCDVNGDNIFDPVTERFYYVSSLYDTTTKTFDEEYAVLIYYTNTLNGVIGTDNIQYASDGNSYNGPVTAATHLPTVETWTNVSLKSTTRQLLNENNENTMRNPIKTLGTFSYINAEGTAYAARLITYKEVITACGDMPGVVAYFDTKQCRHLVENTMYSSDSVSIYGTWMETPYSASNDAYYASATFYARPEATRANYDYPGVRPAIEVKYTDILY